MTSAASFASRWRRAVRSVPDRPFLVFEDEEGRVTEWSYRQFDDVVASTAATLGGLGVVRGSCVHLCLANSPSFVALWLATAGLGACMVPVDPSSSSRELALQIDRVRPAVGVCSEATEDAYREALGASATAPEVVRVDAADPELSALRSPSGGVRPDGPASPAEPAAVMFTSGTTAAPKGVVVTQANYAFAGDVMAAASALRCDDRQLVVLPLFHANAQYYSFAPAISVGASIALMARFSASRFLEQATRHASTHASLFAAPMRMILAKQPAKPEGQSLRNVWYAQNVTADQYAELAHLFGCKPRQLYGMTETIPAVLTNPQLSPTHDALGYPTLGCEVDVEDDVDGSPAQDGEVGEIVVGGERGRCLFAGYLGDEAATERAFRKGRFLTGDLAWREPDGLLRFAGRRSDLLKVAGENVSTVEIEAVLAEHPTVLEAAVIGEPDPIRDEVPVAYVVAAPGEAVDTGDLETWCRARLASAKRPRKIVVVSELPRTSVGKIRKFALG